MDSVDEFYGPGENGFNQWGQVRPAGSLSCWTAIEFIEYFKLPQCSLNLLGKSWFMAAGSWVDCWDEFADINGLRNISSTPASDDRALFTSFNI